MTNNTEALPSFSKEAYCYKILNTYGFLVSFKGDVSTRNLPAPIDDETFAQWRHRILPPGATDVAVYLPAEPKGNTKISTIQQKAGGSLPKRIYKELRNNLTAKHAKDLADTVERITQACTTVPRATLEDIRKDTDLDLTPAIQSFLDRFIESKSEVIGFEELLKDLVLCYNEASKQIAD